MKNVPQQKNNKIYKDNIQQHFVRKHNTCQVPPQFEHEIFQLNIRPQNSNESNFQKRIKTLLVKNLNKNISEEDLYELFGCRKYNIP